MKLFGVDWSFLEGIQPLFQPDDIVYFDRYLDGDPFEDPHYISVFRTALEGVKAGSTAEILYHSAKGRTRRIKCRLQSLEYSEKTTNSDWTSPAAGMSICSDLPG